MWCGAIGWCGSAAAVLLVRCRAAGWCGSAGAMRFRVVASTSEALTPPGRSSIGFPPCEASRLPLLTFWPYRGEKSEVNCLRHILAQVKRDSPSVGRRPGRLTAETVPPTPGTSPWTVHDQFMRWSCPVGRPATSDARGGTPPCTNRAVTTEPACAEGQLRLAVRPRAQAGPKGRTSCCNARPPQRTRRRSPGDGSAPNLKHKLRTSSLHTGFPWSRLTLLRPFEHEATVMIYWSGAAEGR